MKAKIEAIAGDITTIKVDAIVNAANSSLLGGGGVDGAIHRVAGPALLEECRMLGGCPTGMAKYTRAYNLPAKYVIHTVGPVWAGGNKDEDQLLENCYINSLELAEKLKVKTIAFPAISTGIYGFPVERAATIAVKIIEDFLNKSKIQKVVFVCFDKATKKIYDQLINV